MDTALLRGVGSGRATTRTTWHPPFSSRGARASRGLDSQTWQELVLRTGPAGPRGVRVSGGDRLGASHGWAVTPGRARAQHRRILPRRPSLRLTNGPGCRSARHSQLRGAHGMPPKRPHHRSSGRREGRPDLDAQPPLALRRPGLGSESGPGLGSGPRETRGLSTRESESSGPLT